MTKKILEVGDTVPDFTLESTIGTITLSQECAAAEKGVILYFYPRASTPGCTKQACDFRDSLASLLAVGYRVIGISPDTMPALEKFTANQGLNFPLASDPEHTVMEPFGAWGEKQNYGRLITGTIRSTFVINPDQTLAIAQRNVKATGHVARLRKELGLDS